LGLQELKAKINQKYGQRIIYSPAEEMGIIDVPRFSSGSLQIDVDSGGGWPEGKIIEIVGMESSGKTFLVNKAFATITNREKNNKGLLIDEEGSMSKKWVIACGVNIKNLDIVRSQYAEQALDIMEAAVQSGEYGMVALDSIAALIPKTELDGSMEDQQMGLQARLVGKACRKMYRALNSSKRAGGITTVFLINQLRYKIGMVFGNPEISPGGMGPKFAAAIRMDVRKSKMLSDEDESVYAQTSKYTFIKNKVSPPLIKGEFDYFVAGENKAQIDNYKSIVLLGIEMGLLEKSGTWYQPSEWLDKKAQGIEKVIERFKEYDKKRLNKMLKDIEANYLDGEKLSFRF